MKRYGWLLFVVMVAGLVRADFFYDEIADGIRIAGYDGTPPNELVIPGRIKGKPVLELGDAAFKGFTNLTSVTLPDSVTTMGNDCFQLCSNLTRFKIGRGLDMDFVDRRFAQCDKIAFEVASGNERFRAVDGMLIDTKAKMLVYARAKPKTPLRNGELVIPDEIEVIESACFAGRDDIVTISQLPASLKRVWKAGFAYCANLTTLHIPENVEALGFDLIAGCPKMKEIYFYGKPPHFDGHDPHSKTTTISSGFETNLYNDKMIYYPEALKRDWLPLFRAGGKFERAKPKPYDPDAVKARNRRLAQAAEALAEEAEATPKSAIDVALEAKSIPEIVGKLEPAKLREYFDEQISKRYRLLGESLIEVQSVKDFYTEKEANLSEAVARSLEERIDELEAEIAKCLKREKIVHAICKVSARMGSAGRGASYYQISLVDATTKKRISAYAALVSREKLKTGKVLKGYFKESKSSKNIKGVTLKPWTYHSLNKIKDIVPEEGKPLFAQIEEIKSKIEMVQLYPEEAEAQLAPATFEAFLKAYKDGQTFIVGDTGALAPCPNCEGRGVSTAQVNDELMTMYSDDPHGHNSFTSFTKAFSRAATTKLLSDGVACETCAGKKRIPSFSLRKIKGK